MLNLYALLLIFLRSWIYGTQLYRPMILNVGLSSVPVFAAIIGAAGTLALASVLTPSPQATLVNVAIIWSYLIIGTMIWVLFFPNAVYLITELNFSHRSQNDTVPLWFDIVQTLTLTISGIGNAVLSLSIMQFTLVVLIFDPPSGIPAASWIFAATVMLLGAVGVYLGRYLRLNSWDVRHPLSLANKLISHLRSRQKAAEAGGFILTHAALMALIYVPAFTVGYAALANL